MRHCIFFTIPTKEIEQRGLSSASGAGNAFLFNFFFFYSVWLSLLLLLLLEKSTHEHVVYRWCLEMFRHYHYHYCCFEEYFCFVVYLFMHDDGYSCNSNKFELELDKKFVCCTWYKLYALCTSYHYYYAWICIINLTIEDKHGTRHREWMCEHMSRVPRTAYIYIFSIYSIFLSMAIMMILITKIVILFDVIDSAHSW